MISLQICKNPVAELWADPRSPGSWMVALVYNRSCLIPLSQPGQDLGAPSLLVLCNVTLWVLGLLCITVKLLGSPDSSRPQFTHVYSTTAMQGTAGRDVETDVLWQREWKIGESYLGIWCICPQLKFFIKVEVLTRKIHSTLFHNLGFMQEIHRKIISLSSRRNWLNGHRDLFH